MDARTAGPWTVEDYPSSADILGPRGEWIAEVYIKDNANVIGAAPDLLAALIAADAELLLVCGSALRRQIDAALAKAREHLMRRCAIPGCVVLAEDWVWCPFHGDTILKERIRAEQAQESRVGIGAAHHRRAEARGVGVRPWLVDIAIEGGAL